MVSITTSKTLSVENFILKNPINNVTLTSTEILTEEKSPKSKKEEIMEFVSKLKWFNIILLTTIHVIFAIDLYRFPYEEQRDLIMFQFVVGMTAAVGLVAGTHRLWTHRSYKAKLPLRIFLMICYSMTGHNPIFNWVRDHRVHHKYTDTDADPHNSRRGFFFAHIGWLMMKKHPEVKRRGKEIDMSDVLEDPVIQFHQKYYVPLVLLLGFIIPAMIPPLVWGTSWYWSILGSFVHRYVLLLNITWGINSAAHMWGNKPFDNRVSPTDNYTIACFTFGEGWHNYHHTFPWSYRFGHYGGFPADFASHCIDLFAKMGLAYDLKLPSAELVKKAADRYGDSSFPDWSLLELPESAEKEFLNLKETNKKEKAI